MKINPLHVSVSSLVMAGVLAMAPLGQVYANGYQKAREASEAKNFDHAEKLKVKDERFKFAPKESVKDTADHFEATVAGKIIKIDVDHNKGTVKTDSPAAAKAIIDKTLSSGGLVRPLEITFENREEVFEVGPEGWTETAIPANNGKREVLMKKFSSYLSSDTIESNVTMSGLDSASTQKISGLIVTKDFSDRVKKAIKD